MKSTYLCFHLQVFFFHLFRKSHTSEALRLNGFSLLTSLLGKVTVTTIRPARKKKKKALLYLLHWIIDSHLLGGVTAGEQGTPYFIWEDGKTKDRIDTITKDCPSPISPRLSFIVTWRPSLVQISRWINIPMALFFLPPSPWITKKPRGEKTASSANRHERDLEWTWVTRLFHSNSCLCSQGTDIRAWSPCHHLLAPQSH